MKLTRAMINKFIDNVMADVPRQVKYNHNEVVLEIRNKLEEQLPADILDFMKKHPALIYRTKGINLSKEFGKSSYFQLYVVNHESVKPIDVSEYVSTYPKFLAENDTRQAMSARLLELASSCTTLDSLQKLLPELVKYMPEEKVRADKANLPIATGRGVVTDLINSGLKVQA